MANTVISLRSSGATGNTPSLGVLANGELSLNFADGILYYKSAANTLGSIRTTQASGLNKEIQFNDSGSFGSNASLTFDKANTTLTTNNFVANTITTGTGVGGIIAGANVIYANTFVANSTTTSTSNSTGAIISNGGLGVKGNVYADAIYDGGVEVISFANQAFNQANSANVLAQAAFNKANSALSNTNLNVSGTIRALSQGGDEGGELFLDKPATNTSLSAGITIDVYQNKLRIFETGGTVRGVFIDIANSAAAGVGTDLLNPTATPDTVARTTANAAFDKANSANVLAQASFNFANTANIKVDSAFAFANIANIKVDSAFAFANIANTIAQAAFNFANTANIKVDSAFAFANIANIKVDAAFTKANAANVLAQAAFDKANTDTTSITATGGVYGNASIVPVFTLVANGRVSTVTNTAIAIDTAAITSGTIADARLPTKGTAGTYANANHVPVITTDAYGRVTGVTNTAIAITSSAVTGVMTFAQGGANATTYSTGALLTSNGTALVSLANTGTAGTYANASHVPVITTDAYGRVSAVTNTAIAIDTAAITSGTIADARLPTKGTAGTYANASHVPVITTDAYGRVTAVTNTLIQSATTSVQGIVQLTDSISSTSTTTAATPNSVKTAYDLAATKFNSSGGTITGDTTVTGNLIVNGITTTVNTTTVSTTDSLLKLANNNTAGDSLDIGFYGTYNATGQKYAGLVRQAGSNFFLFKDLTSDPTINILATGSATAANTATLRANITGGTVSSLASAIGISDGGTNQTSFTNGIIAYNGTALATLANTGTAGTYANASHVPVITTDAYGRVSAVTNTLVQIAASQVTSGVLPFAQGGSNNTTYTTGAILTSNGTAFVALANTGTAGTYANASHVPVITTDAYGRVSSITNTAIAISAAAVTSGTLAVAQGGTGVATSTGTGAVVLNTAPTLTSINVTNTTVSTSNTTGAITVSGGIGVKGNVYADAIYDGGVEVIAFANAAFNQANSANVLAQAAFNQANTDVTSITATAGVYGNATYVPVITLAANGRISSITNTAISGGGSSPVTISTFNTTANGSTLSYGLGFNPVTANAIFVTIDGVVQPESTYTVNTTANTITFGVEPANTENVRVVAFASTNPYILADGSIDPSKLSVSTNNFIEATALEASVALAIALG
jgi:hypothetical protein